ncbi:hypothetical protein F4859DRAFT_356545 [Xylaria cf. heliscus]|nr:hypothetical protein F4859DRAFT_356545 [Xylaria cf. heliscus]
MADRAPGYEQAAEDLECYNCGMKGHMFFACPEDTRRVPAGLEASRKRQASGSDYHVPAKRSKGPVVTHYPPPPPLGPPHISPPPTFSPGPGYEGFHSGPPSSLPARPPYQPLPPPGHYDQYPPPNAERGAPRGSRHSSSRDAYEHHIQGTPRAPPPERPYRQFQYDQYEEHRPGPSPDASYGRSYSAPDRYDERSAGLPQTSSYAATYRSHQAHFETYPPAPGVDSYYPGPPQPYPPPPLNVHRTSPYYGYDGASTARPFTSGHEPPPPGTYSYQPHQYPHSEAPPHHGRYDERFLDRPPYESPRMDAHSQYSGHRSGESRQNREHYSRRMRYNSPKNRSRSERRFPDRPARLPSPINSTPPAQSVNDAVEPENNQSQQSSTNTVPANTISTEKYTVEDFAWEEEMIFKELPPKITRDLIREPLPVKWTDEPMMPPKYDKETITSKYINSANVDDFSLGIRETKSWQIMQYHPAFLPPADVRIEKLLDYKNALDSGPTYNKQNRHTSSNSTGSRQRGKSWGPRARGSRHTRYAQHHGQSHPSGDDQFNHFRPEATKKNWDHANYRDVGNHERESEGSGREPKISSPEPGEVCETDDQGPTPTTKSTTPSWDPEYHVVSQNHRDHIVSSLQDSRAGPRHLISDSDARPRTPLTPPPPPRHKSGSPSRVSRGRSSPRGPSRPSSRHSSRSNPSPGSSRRSSVGSPLTPTELELLGMRPYSSGSEVGQDSPTPQLNGSANRSRQRPATLHAAYQRRW